MLGFLLKHAILPLGDAVTGQHVMRSLDELRAQVMLDKSGLEQLQGKKLTILLEHAISRVPFYRDKVSSFRRDPWSSLSEFPILTKQDLHAYTPTLVIGNRKHLIASSTSGSSGVQSTIYIDKLELSRERAANLLWMQWAGYRFGMPIVQSGMTPKRGFIKATKDILFRTLYAGDMTLAKSHAVDLLLRIRKGPRRFLMGYASWLYNLARVAEEEGILDIRFHGVMSLGDKMFSHYRDTIRRAFSSEVSDTYGTAEGLLIASQCGGAYYHIMSPMVVLELVNDAGEPVEDGQIGRVVVTKLDGFRMPLIRYATGDLAVKLPKERYPTELPCHLPLLERVIGRDTDIIRTPQGYAMIVHTFTGVFEFFPQIQQFKVIQHKPDGMEIQYIPRADFHHQVLHDVEQRLRKPLCGEPFDMSFTKVDYIAPSPSGKPQIVEVRLGKDRSVVPAA